MDLNHKNMPLSWGLVQLYIFDREIPPVSAQLWRHISYSALRHCVMMDGGAVGHHHIIVKTT